jgi:hypothetical protein
MNKTYLLAICLLLTPFAGCLDEEVEEKQSDNPEFSAPTTLEEIVADYNFTLESTGVSCSEGVAQILADYELVNSFLPEGYEAISYSGEAAVSITSLYCENWSLTGTDFFQGEVLIDIEAPNATGIDGEEINTHYYGLEFYTSNSLLAAKLKLLGWNVFEGAINLEISNLDLIASSEVDSGNSSAYSYEVRSAIPDSVPAGTNRVWHETQNGTSYWDYSFQNVDINRGQAECFISDSIASEAAGTSSCPFDSFGVIIPEMDLVQTLGWFPDTFVTKNP